MSTNFYAHVKLAPTAIWVMHLGKRSGYGLGNLNGQFFPSWKDMKTFLLHNEDNLEIIDENGSYHIVEDFIQEVEDTLWEDRDTQYRYIELNASEKIGSSLQQNTYWKDEDNFTFYRGEFS